MTLTGYFICLILYSFCVAFLMHIKNPTFKYICPECDRLTRARDYDTCKCGNTLRYFDRASDARLTLRQFEKYGLIKKINLKDKDE